MTKKMNYPMKMKGFLFALLLLAGAVGCNEKSETNNSDINRVYPGVVLYNSAIVQQAVAMDGSDVAIKLAMLIDECEGDLSQMEKVTVEIFGKKYLLKPILFGSGNKLTLNEETGEWLVEFLGQEKGAFDTFLRRGSYRVKTHNIHLTQTTGDQTWSVEPDGEMRLCFNNGTSPQYIQVSECESHLLYSRPNIRIRVEDCKAAFESSKEFCSDWDADMTFCAPTPWEDMSFTTHFGDRFTHFGEASGESFYAFNAKDCTEMSYRVDGATPLAYYPSKSGTAAIISGKETISLTDPADYAQTDYPANTVVVERTANDAVTEVRRSITYHGTTVYM